jgi:dephospho-CoA kinase
MVGQEHRVGTDHRVGKEHRSAWPGKYVIGLTGNIATGKSVVRKMLEHLGTYGIDADALSHRVIALGSPGYKPVVEAFGKWVLAPDGQIDRAKLGRLVFADPEALAQLESIVHPFVRQALDILIRRTQQKVVVIEAIKLLEGDLAEHCDSIWVTYAPQEMQIARLMQKRGLSEAFARQRITAQSPQEKKTAAAAVVIQNDGSFEATWQQVYTAWQQLFPSTEAEAVEEAKTVSGPMAVTRARPREADTIARLLTVLSGGKKTVTHEQVMEAFGEKAFLLLHINNTPVGIVGWQVENLVARTDDVYLESNVPFMDGLGLLMREVERASRELECEASLLFLPADMENQENVFRALGYQRRTAQMLGVRAWEEAAEESMSEGSIMLFKQLRQDRVLRPV